jgi:hypothetical protein
VIDSTYSRRLESRRRQGALRDRKARFVKLADDRRGCPVKWKAEEISEAVYITALFAFFNRRCLRRSFAGLPNIGEMSSLATTSDKTSALFLVQ